MTPRRAAMLLSCEMRLAERRARMGTMYLAGPMPTIAQIQQKFGMSNTAAQNWHHAIAQARREFGAGAQELSR